MSKPKPKTFKSFDKLAQALQERERAQEPQTAPETNKKGELNKESQEFVDEILRGVEEVKQQEINEYSRLLDNGLKNRQAKQAGKQNRKSHPVSPQFNQFETFPRHTNMLQDWHDSAFEEVKQNASEQEPTTLELKGDLDNQNIGGPPRNPFVRFDNTKQFPNPKSGVFPEHIAQKNIKRAFGEQTDNDPKTMSMKEAEKALNKKEAKDAILHLLDKASSRENTRKGKAEAKQVIQALKAYVQNGGKITPAIANLAATLEAGDDKWRQYWTVNLQKRINEAVAQKPVDKPPSKEVSDDKMDLMKIERPKLEGADNSTKENLEPQNTKTADKMGDSAQGGVTENLPTPDISQLQNDKTYEKYGVGPLVALSSKDKIKQELQSLKEQLDTGTITRQQYENRVNRAGVLHGAARTSVAEAQKAEMARKLQELKNSQESAGEQNEQIADLQKRIEALEEKIDKLTKALEDTKQSEQDPYADWKKQSERAYDNVNDIKAEPEKYTKAWESLKQKDNKDKQGGEDQNETKEQTESEEKPELPKTYEEALELMKNRAATKATEKLGVKVEDAGKVRSWLESMPRWKRALLYGAIGAAAAAGAMAGGFLGAPLVAALGYPAGASYLGLAGLLGMKFLGGLGGHKLARWAAGKTEYSMDRAKAAAGYEKAVRDYEKVLKQMRKKTEEIEKLNQQMGGGAVSARTEIPTMTEERLNEMITKGMKRAEYMPAVASILTSTAVGLFWHWSDWFGSRGAPQTPAQTPAQSGPVTGGSTHTILDPPQGPPTAQPAGGPGHGPTPPSGGPKHLPDRFFDSTASPWSERVPLGQEGVAGSPLSVDAIAGHIDTLSHAPTFTEGVQDVLTKVAKNLHWPLNNPAAAHDLNLLAEKIAQSLDVKGFPGAQEVLQSVGTPDVDNWMAGKTYNLRGIFTNGDFINRLIETIKSDGRFNNPKAVVTMINEIVKRA